MIKMHKQEGAKNRQSEGRQNAPTGQTKEENGDRSNGQRQNRMPGQNEKSNRSQNKGQSVSDESEDAAGGTTENEMQKGPRSNSSRGRNENSSRQEDDDEKESSPRETALHELFLDQVGDMYNAEQQLIKALPKMAKAAKSDELREAFESHLVETQTQAGRLEELVASIGEELKRKKCKAMEGLLEEGKAIVDEYKGNPALDAALIAAAQKVEHYEIASYGTLRAWAEQLGHEKVELLEESLGEEKAADEKLSKIGESLANNEVQRDK